MKNLVQVARFINAEPAKSGVTPIVVLSFGAEEGPVEDKAISVEDARSMIVDLLQSLSFQGDELAQEIHHRFFNRSEH